jgi:TonB family protein
MSNISTSQMLSIGVVLLPLVVGAQVPPIPSPLERLQQVTAVTSLDDPAVKPWHLKLALQFFEHKGTPAGVGTIEEWWAGPKRYKITYDTPDYKATVLKTETGDRRTSGTSYVPPLLELLREQTVHPMPGPDAIAATTPTQRTESLGKLQLDCIMLAQPLKGETRPTPLGLFPTYCVAPDSDMLRITSNFGTQLIIRDGVGKFQDHLVPTDVALLESSVRTAKSHLAQLATIPSGDETAFGLTPDLVLLAPALTRSTLKAAEIVSGAIVSGHKTGGNVPIYPQDAKNRRVSGSVVLHALIGRDGHVRSLTPVSSPDASLSEAAIAAVQTWVYTPYLINGEPTDVDTTIKVNFALQ